MISKPYIWILMGIAFLAQLFVPAKMIWDREQIIKHGQVHKFKTQPIDPIDPFRGKYITLNFEADRFKTENAEDFERHQQVYALLGKDSLGFSVVEELSLTKPTKGESYLKTKISYPHNKYVNLEFPFDRFYMEEGKAKPAEDLYRRSNRNRNQDKKPAYALVSILDGGTVLTDVYINDKPILEALKDEQQ